MMSLQGKIKTKQIYKSVKKIETLYAGGKVELSPDGTYIVSTCNETIKGTKISCGTTIFTLKGDGDIFTSWAIRPNGLNLVSASRSLMIQTWDLISGKIIRRMRGHDQPILVMEFDSTGTFFATGAADGTVRVWDAEGGFCTHHFKGHQSLITTLKFHPDENLWTLFSSSDDGKICAWHLLEKKCLNSFEGHMSSVRSLDVSFCGKFLVSVGRDKTIHVWNVHKGRLEKMVAVMESLEAGCIIASERMRTNYHSVGNALKHDSIKELGLSDLRVAVAGEKGIIRVFDMNTLECSLSQVVDGLTVNPVTNLIYEKEHHRLTAVYGNHNIIMYDASTLCSLHQLVGYNDEILDIRFVGKDESLLAVATNSEELKLFNMDTLDGTIIRGHTDTLLALDASSDGSFLISGSKDHTARVWRVGADDVSKRGSAECLAVCVGHTEAVSAVAFSRKTPHFVVTGSQDRTLKLWELASLGSTSNGKETRAPARYTIKAHDKDINSIDISPNDKLIATGSQDKTASLWNSEDGKLLTTLRGHKRGVWSVQFSDYDQILATSSGDKTIRVWSARDFSCLRTFEGHANSVLKVSFMNRGTQLVSSGSEGLLKLWTIKTGECIATLDAHVDKVWSLCVRKDDGYIVSGGADSLIQVWQDFSEQEEENQRAAQELKLRSEEQLANYLLRKDYKNAMIVAMSLQQPFRLFSIFNDILESPNHSYSDREHRIKMISEIFKSFTSDQVATLLSYIRDWNTNAKHGYVAQSLLYLLFRSFSPTYFMENKSMKPILEALLPYTERHLQRADQSVTNSFILDYTLQSMDLLIGPLQEENLRSTIL